MKITFMLDTLRERKHQTISANFILPFVLIVITSSLLAQDNNFTVEQFDYSNFKQVENRTGPFSYPINGDIKKIEYTHLELDDNSIERIRKVISSSFKNLSSVGVVGNLTKKKLSITSSASLNIQESDYKSDFGDRYISDGKLRVGMELSSIDRVSLIVSNDNDTLILLPREIRVSNQYTSVEEDIKLLYYIDLQSCINIYLENKKLINDVLTLEKHISALKNAGLKLTDDEKTQLNINIQNRIIDSLNSKLPKYYLTIVNRVEPNSATKTQRTYSYCYIVEKYASDHFFGLGQKNDTFPIMDVKMVDDPDLKNVYLLDTIEIDLYNRKEIIEKIRSTDYLDLLFDVNAKINRKGFFKKEFTPSLIMSDTLYITKNFKTSPNKINFHIDSIPSYEKFIKNHTKIPNQDDFPFLNISSIMNNRLISEIGTYNNSEIYFDVVMSNAKGGFNSLSSRDYLLTKLDVLIGTHRKEMYNYASEFLDYNIKFDQKVGDINEKRKLEAEEKEKQAQKELYQKYGKKYVDALYDLKIIVGMPEDLVNVIVNKLYTVGSSSSSGTGSYYRLDPRYGTGWVSVWIKNKKVTSVTYH